MAPGRRRGANKAKANGHLSLGDLVLAKVKGFPAWPAKVSLSSFFYLFLFQYYYDYAFLFCDAYLISLFHCWFSMAFMSFFSC